MAMQKSVFDPTNNDDRPIQGGLDRFLGPPASSYSHMPGELTDGKTDDESAADVEAEATSGDPERGDWNTNPDEPVQQIKQALDEKLATEPAKPEDIESHPAD
jgi:hypothetical protein